MIGSFTTYNFPTFPFVAPQFKNETRGLYMFHITTPEVTRVDTRNESAFVLRIAGMPRAFTAVAYIEVSESIPESFLAGWADYEAGRVRKN
jgi:hypothetical protein